MMMVRVAPAGQECAYCGSADYRVVVRFPQGTAVRCARCRLVRTMPYPTFEYSDNRGYAEGYAGRERLFARFAREFMDFIERHAPGKELLEVGCGMGFLLEEAKRRGFQARGLEVNRWEVAALRERGLAVDEGTLEAAHLESGSFDVVCMSHVLEHVPDLRDLLSEVHRILRPCGLLAVGQPNYAAALPRICGHLWYGWQWEQHIWHFDASALRGILSEQGFECREVMYRGMHHAWLPLPRSWRPKVLLVQAGIATLASVQSHFGPVDQYYLAARRGA